MVTKVDAEADPVMITSAESLQACGHVHEEACLHHDHTAVSGVHHNTPGDATAHHETGAVGHDRITVHIATAEHHESGSGPAGSMEGHHPL